MRPNGIISSFALDKLTVADIEKITQDLIDETRAAYDKVGSLKPEEVNFESCIQVQFTSVNPYYF
jgi:hypothetical protein